MARQIVTLQWRHNQRDGVSHHQPYICLLNGLFKLRSEKTSKLRVTIPCEGNSPVTAQFLAQRASNAENVSILWRHHDIYNNFWHMWCLLTTVHRWKYISERPNSRAAMCMFSCKPHVCYFLSIGWPLTISSRTSSVLRSVTWVLTAALRAWMRRWRNRSTSGREFSWRATGWGTSTLEDARITPVRGWWLALCRAGFIWRSIKR